MYLNKRFCFKTISLLDRFVNNSFNKVKVNKIENTRVFAL